MADYFPSTEPARKAWFQNYKTQVAIDGPALGLSVLEISAQQAACQDCIDAYSDVDAKTNAAAGAVKAKDATVKQKMSGELRTDIKKNEARPRLQ